MPKQRTLEQIVDMLNEHDCFELEKQGFKYGDKDSDVDLLNDYLENYPNPQFSKLRVPAN